MSEDRVEKLISRINGLGDQVDDFKGLPQSIIYRCEAKPVSLWAPTSLWKGGTFEILLGVTLPPDLKEFWNWVSGLCLWEDITYGQWGLIIWGPDEVMTKHPIEIEGRERDFCTGDLVIGEFRGDSDLPILRCDPTKADFGTIMIALPTEQREDWYALDLSLLEFRDGSKTS